MAVLQQQVVEAIETEGAEAARCDADGAGAHPVGDTVFALYLETDPAGELLAAIAVCGDLLGTR